MNNRSIVFIGFASSGKSTIGALVAKKKGFSFIDLDERIETHYRTEHGESLSCRALFKDLGQTGFATLESQALIHLGPQKATVLATGGGAPLTTVNQQLLKNFGIVYYLYASPLTIQARMINKGIPASIYTDAKNNSIEHHFSVRDPIYSMLADATIQTDAKDIHTISTEVIKHYEQYYRNII